MRQKRFTKGLKQCAVDRVALRIVLRVPLDGEGEARRVGNPDRLDRAVFRDALDDDPLARFQDALTMKRIDTDGLATEQPREGAAGNEIDVMTVGEDNVGVGVDFTVLQPRHPMVYTPGQIADFRMPRAADGHIHLLQPPSNTQPRYPACATSYRHPR